MHHSHHVCRLLRGFGRGSLSVSSGPAEFRVGRRLQNYVSNSTYASGHSAPNPSVMLVKWVNETRDCELTLAE